MGDQTRSEFMNALEAMLVAIAINPNSIEDKSVALSDFCDTWNVLGNKRTVGDSDSEGHPV